jgi:hypothetical protein
MERLLSTKDFAEAIGASESSLRRWTNLGVIKTFRTVGGHRRIALSEAVRFIRESHATVVRPEKLGLTPMALQTGGAGPLEAVEQEIGLALERGETEIAKSKILSMYLGGASISSIFDGPIQHAMRRLGIENKSQLQRDIEKLCDQLLQQNARLIIGGRQAGEINTRNLPNVFLLKSMTELAAFTRGAKPLPPPGAAKTP